MIWICCRGYAILIIPYINGGIVYNILHVQKKAIKLLRIIDKKYFGACIDYSISNMEKIDRILYNSE